MIITIFMAYFVTKNRRIVAPDGELLAMPSSISTVDAEYIDRLSSRVLACRGVGERVRLRGGQQLGGGAHRVHVVCCCCCCFV